MNSVAKHIVGKPRLLFRPHAVLGWSLTPSYGVKVRFRPDVIQNIDVDGWRAVPGRPCNRGPRLSVYGCSFTYGTGLADRETYVAQLQEKLPNACLMNRGVGGYSTVQNYLQFRRDILDGGVDAAIFAVISDHRFRNIAHPQRMQQFLKKDWYLLGVEHVPVVRQGHHGSIKIEYVPIWQPALKRGGFENFLPDEHMIDGATIAIMEEVETLAKSNNVPLRFALLDQLDPGFNEAVKNRFVSSIDVSVPLDREMSFYPNDVHPNQIANRLYSDRLLPIAEELISCAGGRPS